MSFLVVFVIFNTGSFFSHFFPLVIIFDSRMLHLINPLYFFEMFVFVHLFCFQVLSLWRSFFCFSAL